MVMLRASLHHYISDNTTCLIAAMDSIDILASNSRRHYDRTCTIFESHTWRRQAMTEFVSQKWDDSYKGHWTYRIIPVVKVDWTNYGEIITITNSRGIRKLLRIILSLRPCQLPTLLDIRYDGGGCGAYCSSISQIFQPEDVGGNSR